MANPARRMRWTEAEAVSTQDDVAERELRRQQRRIQLLLASLSRSLPLKDACAIGQLRMRLSELARSLPRHFELMEARRSLRELVRVAPDLAYRAARLRGHHSALRQEVQSLLELAASIEHECEIERLTRRLAPFVRMLETHRVEEEALTRELRDRSRLPG